MPETVESIIMELEARDNASKPVQQLVARIKQLEKEIKDLRVASQALTRAQDQENKSFQESVRNTTKLEQANNKLVKSQQNVQRAIDDTIDARRRDAEAARLFGDVESRTRAITGGIGFVGGAGGTQIERTVNVGAEVLASAEAVGLLKQELPQLAANLGITKQNAGLLAIEMGVLVGATLIAKDLIGDLAKGLKDVQVAVAGQIDAHKKYQEFIQTATTEDFNTRLDELNNRREINERFKADLIALSQAVEQGLDVSSQGVLEGLGEGALRAFDALGGDIGFDKINEALNETSAELTSTYTEFNLLTTAFTEGAFAANDAAKREREYTAAKIEGLEREARIAIEATTLTQDQLDKRLAAIVTERDAYTKFLNELQSLEQTDQVVAEIDDVKDKLSELGEEQRLLTEIAGPLVEATERETLAAKMAADAIELQAKNTEIAQKVYQNAAAQQGKLAADLAAVEQKRLDLVEDYAQKTLEIEEERNLKLVQDAEKFALERTNKLADHYREMAELDRDYYEARGELLDNLNEDLADINDEELEAIKDFNKESRRLAEDHRDRLIDIQRDANRDIASAASRLDAVGIFEASQRAKEQLDDEKKQYEKSKERREEDFQDQLDQYKKERQERQRQYRQDLQDLRRQHERERAEKEAAFRLELQREDQRRQLEAQHQQQQWAREDTQRQAQFNKESNALDEHYSRLLTLTVDGLYQIELAYQAWLESMAAQTTTAPTTTSGIGGGGSGTGTLVFAAGGYPPLNRDVVVGERGPEIVRFQQPARIYAHGQRPSVMDGASIVINIDGARAPMQVGAQVRRELKRIITEAA